MSISKQERDRLGKIKDQLLQSLLSAGLCVDDVLRTKGDNDSPTPREKLSAAFKRGYVHLKGGMVELVSKQYKYEDLEYIFNGMDFLPPNRHLSLPKTLSLVDVSRVLTMADMGSWRSLSYEDKLEVLWQLGLCVRTDEVSEEENASKYYIDRKLHRNADNKVVYGLCITANERTDEAWKRSPHASLEAKLYTEDVELARDLQEMGRVKVS